jgi:spore protease
MKQIRTDLAVEICDHLRRNNKTSDGIECKKETCGRMEMDRIEIKTCRGESLTGKPKGIYRTLNTGKIWLEDRELFREKVVDFSRFLSQLIREKMPSDGTVLVAGLGNRSITADAIGPLAVDALLVTRHLKDHEPEIFRGMACCAVSALAPGVLGQTGMEVAEIVAGATRRCRPDAIIAIDALAARSCDRLAATIQLTNTGISPGSGVGNDRCALTSDTMGIPVIALGVPTVVDSSTLVYDALAQAGIEQVDDRLREILENGRRFYVSPKEADVIAERTAAIIAHAINRALVGVAGLA